MVGDCRTFEVGVKVHLAVAEFGKEIDARLAFGHAEGATVELAKTLRQGFEFLGVIDERLHLFFSAE